MTSSIRSVRPRRRCSGRRSHDLTLRSSAFILKSILPPQHALLADPIDGNLVTSTQIRPTTGTHRCLHFCLSSRTDLLLPLSLSLHVLLRQLKDDRVPHSSRTLR